MNLLNVDFDLLAKECRQMLSKYRREYKALPKGRLQKKGRYLYRSVRSGRDKNGRPVYRLVSLNSDERKLKQTARREFLRISIDVLETNLAYLKKMKPMPSFGNIIPEMKGAYRDLPADCFCEPGRESREWGIQDYPHLESREDEKRHITSFGLRMRSKAEVIIAEELYKRKLYFHYEEELAIKASVFYPDFTIYLAGGRKVYWEHCGMMDNIDYRRHHLRKMSFYEAVGIVPWDNLIVTYDRNGSIDMREINAMIEIYLQ